MRFDICCGSMGGATTSYINVNNIRGIDEANNSSRNITNIIKAPKLRASYHIPGNPARYFRFLILASLSVPKYDEGWRGKVRDFGGIDKFAGRIPPGLLNSYR